MREKPAPANGTRWIKNAYRAMQMVLYSQLIQFTSTEAK